MSGRTVITTVVICGMAFLLAWEHGGAAHGAAGEPRKIGIVSVRTVFNTSRRHSQYRAEVMARQGQASAQIDKLQKQIQAEDAELKTLKQGTADYMQQLQLVLQKRSQLDSQQEYLKQQRVLEDKKWMEDLYQEILSITQAVAQAKGLDLVLEKTEPEFPISSEELMLTLSTHKVLYDGGCIDLTEEVTARLDATDRLNP